MSPHVIQSGDTVGLVGWLLLPLSLLPRAAQDDVGVGHLDPVDEPAAGARVGTASPVRPLLCEPSSRPPSRPAGGALPPSQQQRPGARGGGVDAATLDAIVRAGGGMGVVVGSGSETSRRGAGVVRGLRVTLDVVGQVPEQLADHLSNPTNS